jgi:hypothetical protein
MRLLSSVIVITFHVRSQRIPATPAGSSRVLDPNCGHVNATQHGKPTHTALPSPGQTASSNLMTRLGFTHHESLYCAHRFVEHAFCNVADTLPPLTFNQAFNKIACLRLKPSSLHSPIKPQTKPLSSRFPAKTSYLPITNSRTQPNHQTE